MKIKIKYPTGRTEIIEDLGEYEFVTIMEDEGTDNFMEWARIDTEGAEVVGTKFMGVDQGDYAEWGSK